MLPHYDPDPQRSTQRKLEDAITRYQDHYGTAPTVCVTSPLDAAELADANPPLTIRSRSYIARYLLYLGEEEAS